MFYICPAANTSVCELVESARALKLIRQPEKPRTPIAERAQALEAKSSVFRSEARGNIGKIFFELGGNHFTLLDLAESSDGKIIAETIAYLAAIFKHSYIGIWVEDFEEVYGRSQLFTLLVSNKEIDFPDNNCKLTKEEKEKMLFEIKFVINKEELYLSNINSEQSGLGGMGLAMLYNLAKKAGVQHIKFWVRHDNKPAKSFYVYNDFGTPLRGDLSGTWILKIPPDRKL